MSKPAGERYTVAVDFDGVLHSYVSPWVNAHTIPDPPVDGAIQWLEKISGDFTVVIFTTRGKTPEGRLAVQAWLAEHGLSKAYAYSLKVTDQKPPALVYIDDRAWRFNGYFPNAEEIHRARPWNKPPASPPLPPDAAPDAEKLAKEPVILSEPSKTAVSLQHRHRGDDVVCAACWILRLGAAHATEALQSAELRAEIASLKATLRDVAEELVKERDKLIE